MEKEFEKELLDLKAECKKNPNIHPHCEHVVDLAISEIKRLEEQYETDTVWFHNKWMEAIKNSQTRWIPVSDRLPEIGQKVKIRRCSDYYEALYDPKNQFLPWQLIDERDGSVSALFRRREFVDEWQEV